MPIFPASPESIARAAAVLKSGGTVGMPTETVYGLGADATNEDAVRKIFKIKQRPPTNPLIVHVDSTDSIFKVSSPSKEQEALLNLLKPFWPGPLSVILPASPRIAPSVTAGQGTVAVRIPNHPTALALIKESGLPIAAPSANLSTQVSPTTAQHVYEGLGDSVDLILDGGPCTVGLESTIISLMTSPPTLLRAGGVPVEELSKVLGEISSTSETTTPSGALLSPGLMKEHYAPKTPLVLRGERSPSSFPLRTGLISFKGSSAPLEFDYSVVSELSKSGDLTEVATKLFAALRELDRLNLELLVVDTCEATGIGRAIMDRLIRASARTRNSK